MNDLDYRPEVERKRPTYPKELQRIHVKTEHGEAEFIIVQTEKSGGVEVWNYLPDHEWNEGYIIGIGATRDAAVADAVGMLEAMTDALQHPSPESLRAVTRGEEPTR